jgi:hypothetical protein
MPTLDPRCVSRVRLAAISELVAAGGEPSIEQVEYALAPLLAGVLPPLWRASSPAAPSMPARRLWGRIRWSLVAWLREAHSTAQPSAATTVVSGNASSRKPQDTPQTVAKSKRPARAKGPLTRFREQVRTERILSNRGQ